MVQVRHRRVELIELFYDLIYVYAIARLTESVVDAPSLEAGELVRYLLAAFIILQSWLYLTNYVNRYATWSWWEYGFVAVNMVAATYMANTLTVGWLAAPVAFSASMLVMLLCVGAMYAVRACRGGAGAAAARNSLLILSVVCALYATAWLCALAGVRGAVFWIDLVAVLAGAFLPFGLRGHFDASVISFPHLAERFELLTILTFGEAVVGAAGYFDVSRLTVDAVLVMVLLLVMFGCYVLQLHVLCDHERVARSLLLMFSHYFIVIAVNMVTVALELLEHGGGLSRIGVVVLFAVALSVFFVAMYADAAYYAEGVRFGVADGLWAGVGLVAGIVAMVACRGSVTGVLVGALVAVSCNFAMLERKRRGMVAGRQEP